MNQALQEFNSQMQHLKKARNLGAVFTLVVIFTFVVLILIKLQLSSFIDILALFMVGFGSGTYGVSDFRARQLRLNFKNKVMPKIIEENFPELHYSPEDGFSSDDVKATSLVSSFDRFSSEDYVYGSIEGVEFTSSDVRIEQKKEVLTEVGKLVDYTTLIFGRIFRFRFNKDLEGLTIVQRKDAPVPTQRSSLKLIEMESIEFNDKFAVYSTDEHSAYYLLTPDIMESILQLKNHFDGSLTFSYCHQTLNIGLNNYRNTFEIPLDGPISQESINLIIHDFRAIQEFIRAMKLNNRLFKK